VPGTTSYDPVFPEILQFSEGPRWGSTTASGRRRAPARSNSHQPAGTSSPYRDARRATSSGDPGSVGGRAWLRFGRWHADRQCVAWQSYRLDTSRETDAHEGDRRPAGSEGGGSIRETRVTYCTRVRESVDCKDDRRRFSWSEWRKRNRRIAEISARVSNSAMMAANSSTYVLMAANSSTYRTSGSTSGSIDPWASHFCLSSARFIREQTRFPTRSITARIQLSERSSRRSIAVPTAFPTP
jgi:hypothetical protein